VTTPSSWADGARWPLHVQSQHVKAESGADALPHNVTLAGPGPAEGERSDERHVADLPAERMWALSDDRKTLHLRLPPSPIDGMT
jgi:hypothetical protein